MTTKTCHVCGAEARYDERVVLGPAGWTRDKEKRDRCPRHEESSGFTATLGELAKTRTRKATW